MNNMAVCNRSKVTCRIGSLEIQCARLLVGFGCYLPNRQLRNLFMKEITWEPRYLPNRQLRKP